MLKLFVLAQSIIFVDKHQPFRLLKISVTLSYSLYLSQEEELERLEREFAIQSQITEAARRLASDPHVSSKKLKKQRKTSYLNALKKLQEIENSINEHRVRSGKKPTQRASLIIEGENTHSHTHTHTHTHTRAHTLTHTHTSRRCYRHVL